MVLTLTGPVSDRFHDRGRQSWAMCNVMVKVVEIYKFRKYGMYEKKDGQIFRKREKISKYVWQNLFGLNKS